MVETKINKPGNQKTKTLLKIWFVRCKCNPGSSVTVDCKKGMCTMKPQPRNIFRRIKLRYFACKTIRKS